MKGEEKDKEIEREEETQMANKEGRRHRREG